MVVEPGRQMQSEALLLNVFPRPSGLNFLMDMESEGARGARTRNDTSPEYP